MVGQSSNSPRRSVPARVAAFTATLAPVSVLAGAVALLNPGEQLERGLSTAAAAEARVIAASAPAASPGTAVAARAFEEGSEGFWLTRAPEAENVTQVVWSAPVAPGDRVVVNFGAYDREILDVVSVAEDGGATTRIDTGEGKAPRYVITGRRLSAPTAGLVRLTVDAEGRGLTTISSGRDRAL